MDSLALEAGSYLAALFLICMLCHGELVRIRPGSRHLTLFYLMIAAGGALGGLFVALVCPRIFTSFVESDICLIGGAVLAAFDPAAGVVASRAAVGELVDCVHRFSAA